MTSGGGGNGTKIYRSTDDTGSNNQTTPWFSVTSPFDERAICADHFNSERVLYVANNAPDVIREIKRLGGELKDDVLRDENGKTVNLRTKILAVLASEDPAITVPTGATAIRQLLADPNQRGVYYAIAGLHGMPNWWRTVDDGVTWTNISGEAPRTMWKGGIHPMTGEVMGFTSVGEYIHRSPAIYPALPDRDALSDQLLDYYSKAPGGSIIAGTGAGTSESRKPLGSLQ